MEQPNLTQNLLARAQSPDTASRLYNEKIRYRPQYLRPFSPPVLVHDAREARRAARRQARELQKKTKPKPLSARERHRLGLYRVPKERQHYALYEPLHRLWVGYMHELLGADLTSGRSQSASTVVNTAAVNVASKLTSAEMMGAKVHVARSKCVSRVGIHGIVIRDTKFALEIITPKDALKLVPKEGTFFRIAIPTTDNAKQEVVEEKIFAPEETKETSPSDYPKLPGAWDTDALVVEILGDQFLYRGPDRVNKKFKDHFLKKL